MAGNSSELHVEQNQKEFPPYVGEAAWRSERVSNETNQDMLATRGPGGGPIIQLIVSGKKKYITFTRNLKT